MTAQHAIAPRAAPRAASGAQGRLADILVCAALFLAFWAFSRLTPDLAGPLSLDSAAAELPLDLTLLPGYAGRSLLRMGVALALAVAFSFGYATLAARVRGAERLMIPALDVLQSVPVLGFLAVTLPVWLALFPDSMLGLEAAAVFAIFTSQVWNMTFAFYQALIAQPTELDEAARALRLTRWQRFWKLDAPSGAFPLVWNGMMSFGGGWFFLIASEVFTVGHREVALPGLGSFAAAAAERERIDLLLIAAAVMVALIWGVNVLFWRPVTAWAERFRLGNTDTSEPQTSVVYDLLRRSAIPAALRAVTRPVRDSLDRLTRVFGRTRRHPRRRRQLSARTRTCVAAIVAVTVAGCAVAAAVSLQREVGAGELATAGGLGLITLARVAVVVVLGSAVWVPIGVWIGVHPRITRVAQPLVQILASFPANFLFPVFALGLVATGISLNLGGILLMALGSQWYILFNVIAGAAAIPIDLREATRSLRVRGSLAWRTLYGPAIFGSWVTGALTAAGGAWNASIVAEIVSYGDTTLTASGLGAHIAQATAAGDTGRVLLGVLVMSALVIATNRLVWRPLYRLAQTRYSLA